MMKSCKLNVKADRVQTKYLDRAMNFCKNIDNEKWNYAPI